MKRATLYFICILAGAQAVAQNFSLAVKQYIDYDTSVVAFTHCILADVKNVNTKANQTVIIRQGMIVQIGDDQKIKIPKEAVVIDLTGKSLLPGFVLMHEHMYYAGYAMHPNYNQLKQLPVTFPKLYLACGATTIRTAGSVEPYADLSIKQNIDSGMYLGPNIDVTAPYVEGKGTQYPQMHQLSGPAEAKAFVDFWVSQGATSFKAYNYLDKATLKAAIDEVHAKGLKITGHLCSITYREAAEMGIDELEHGFFVATDFLPNKKENECIQSDSPFQKLKADSKEIKDLIQYLISRKVTVTSTLAIFYTATTLNTYIRPEILEAMAPDTRDIYLNVFNKFRDSNLNKVVLEEMQIEKEFSDSGGLLTVGTDPTGNGSVIAGYGSQMAIELLVKAGFTPMEAIRIATLNGAKALGLESKIGSIEVGKKADLVVIDGDISQNIEHIRNIVWVFKGGVGFNAQKIFASVKGQVGMY